MKKEPEIKEKAAFTVVGLKYHGKAEGDEIPQTWQALMEYADDVGSFVDFDASYGVMGNYDAETGEYDYVAGWEKVGESEVPEDLTTWDVPAQTYAVFEVQMNEIQEAYEYIYNTWLPQSEYQHAAAPEFEYYDASFNPDDPASTLYVYVPVMPI
jgi:AraC family transcriptional regulator